MSDDCVPTVFHVKAWVQLMLWLMVCAFVGLALADVDPYGQAIPTVLAAVMGLTAAVISFERVAVMNESVTARSVLGSRNLRFDRVHSARIDLAMSGFHNCRLLPPRIKLSVEDDPRSASLTLAADAWGHSDLLLALIEARLAACGLMSRPSPTVSWSGRIHVNGFEWLLPNHFAATPTREVSSIATWGLVVRALLGTMWPPRIVIRQGSLRRTRLPKSARK